MDFMNYFELNTEQVLLVNYFIYLAITVTITCINLIFFIKAYRNVKRNLPSIKPARDFLWAMFGFIIWDLGVISEDIVRIASNNTYKIFSSIENMPFTAGLTLSIIFFNRHLFNYILVNKRNSKEAKPVKGFLTFFSILCAFCFVVSFIRFILLGFMPTGFREQTLDITMLVFGVIAFSGAVTMIIALLQLNGERKILTSKLNRARMKIYMIVAITFFLIIGDVVLFILSFEFIPETQMGQTLRLWLGLPIDSIYVFAMMALYTGMLMPEWVQQKMGVLPQLNK